MRTERAGTPEGFRAVLCSGAAPSPRFPGHRCPRYLGSSVLTSGVEKVVKKHPLTAEKTAPLVADREESLRIFSELLRRGRSFYPDHGIAKGYPRVCRVAPLREG